LKSRVNFYIGNLVPSILQKKNLNAPQPPLQYK